MPRFCSFSPLKWHWMHPILKASRKILTSKYYDKFAFIQIRDSMGAHLIFFIIFTLFSCIILTNQSLPWYSLRSGFPCDTNMAAVFSGMRPTAFTIYKTGEGGEMSSQIRQAYIYNLQRNLWNSTHYVHYQESHCNHLKITTVYPFPKEQLSHFSACNLSCVFRNNLYFISLNGNWCLHANNPTK